MFHDMTVFSQFFAKENLVERYGGPLKEISVRQYLESKIKPKETLGQYLHALYERRNPSEPVTAEELNLD